MKKGIITITFIMIMISSAFASAANIKVAEPECLNFGNLSYGIYMGYMIIDCDEIDS